jgi:hypothetical protein
VHPRPGCLCVPRRSTLDGSCWGRGAGSQAPRLCNSRLWAVRLESPRPAPSRDAAYEPWGRGGRPGADAATAQEPCGEEAQAPGHGRASLWAHPGLDGSGLLPEAGEANSAHGKELEESGRPPQPCPEHPGAERHDRGPGMQPRVHLQVNPRPRALYREFRRLLTARILRISRVARKVFTHSGTGADAAHSAAQLSLDRYTLNGS